ncbi:hypothetical protein [Hymenobacter terricola]|uniref:hypothetical protein n=1 Tax=Hymenobacter terricola TaxID=2819236 RepID=UPI001B301026|nr:hypothetical protein [Hymenobacter terricola]
MSPKIAVLFRSYSHAVDGLASPVFTPTNVFVDGFMPHSLTMRVAPDSDVLSGMPATAESEATGLPNAAYSARIHCVLGQNAPNPVHSHAGETAVLFQLVSAADVHFSLFDPRSRKLTSVIRKGLSAGVHRIGLDLRGLGLAAGEYVYQLKATTAHGVCLQHKTMVIQ